MERYDVLIVGAGFSGLAAGIRLARNDLRVAVLERHYLWGGLNSFYKRKGRLFDVGLHALTNYSPAGSRGTPLARILRQLRIRHAELRLGEQSFSTSAFPDVNLSFSNDPSFFKEEVCAKFPAEVDGLERLFADLDDFYEPDPTVGFVSARKRLEEYFRDPQLIDLLMLPCSYYGSAAENDMDWPSFAILFRSLFVEGLARPEDGMRPVLKLLVDKFREAGGELLMRNGVKRIRTDTSGKVERKVLGVELDDGTELEAPMILSSAGRVETLRMTDAVQVPETKDVGRLGFVESVAVLDSLPVDLGMQSTLVFFNATERFAYRRPDSLVDLSSGVIATPNNYERSTPLVEGQLRLTLLANPERWKALGEEDYAAAKERLSEEAYGVAARFVPDVRPHIVFKDVFTPRTVERFTGHVDGTIYGSPNKAWDGSTEVDGLVLCGTDQGYLGITGALLSGILVANRHVLEPRTKTQVS